MCPWDSPQGLGMGLGELGIKGRIGTIQITALLKSTRILGRFAVTWTSVKNHQLKLMWWWPKERPHWFKKNKQRTPSKQLQTHNLPTDEEENMNSTNKGRYLLLANKLQIVPWGTERMPQRIQRHSRITLHRQAHPKREQDQTEKFTYGLDWRQNAYDMVPQS